MSEANVNKKTKGSRKVRTGYVVSDKMQKTIVVELEDRKQHALYGKTIRTNSKMRTRSQVLATWFVSRKPGRCQRTSISGSSKSSRRPGNFPVALQALSAFAPSNHCWGRLCYLLYDG